MSRYIFAGSATTDDHAVNQALKRKVTRVGEACRQEGIAFIPMAANTLGRWHIAVVEQVKKLGSVGGAPPLPEAFSSLPEGKLCPSGQPHPWRWRPWCHSGWHRVNLYFCNIFQRLICHWNIRYKEILYCLKHCCTCNILLLGLIYESITKVLPFHFLNIWIIGQKRWNLLLLTTRLSSKIFRVGYE